MIEYLGQQLYQCLTCMYQVYCSISFFSRSNICRVINTRSAKKENKFTDVANPVAIGDDVTNCIICLEKFSGDATKINIGVLTSCGHYYHFDCLWEWLRKHLSCPICRNNVRWSERDIRAVIYARLLEDDPQQTGVSFVPRGEEDTLSVTSTDSLEYSGCFPRLTNLVIPTVQQALVDHLEYQSLPAVQETRSFVTLAEMYFIWAIIPDLIVNGNHWSFDNQNG